MHDAMNFIIKDLKQSSHIVRTWTIYNLMMKFSDPNPQKSYRNDKKWINILNSEWTRVKEKNKINADYRIKIHFKNSKLADWREQQKKKQIFNNCFNFVTVYTFRCINTRLKSNDTNDVQYWWESVIQRSVDFFFFPSKG